MTIPDFKQVFEGRRVLVTGHTGFKGSWLCEWLLQLGASVSGYALDPPTDPSLYNGLSLASDLQNDVRGEIRDLTHLQQVVQRIQPEFVFHLAAQPLVRYSYLNPLETWEVNVMGTGNLLEAVRATAKPCAVVVITTDKCYENREWEFGYRETDPMGGADPYSSSKGMAELLVSSWRHSFAQNGEIRVASVRAGNVIGGGDWALDRIIPDCIRSLSEGQPIQVRNPVSRRPWQHVLDPLSGYLQLAAELDVRQPWSDRVSELCDGFNFGPAADSNRTVAEVVEQLLVHIPGSWESNADPSAVHEAKLLHLCTDRARMLLNWQPHWNFHTAVQMTAEWYAAFLANQDLKQMTRQQIDRFTTEGSV